MKRTFSANQRLGWLVGLTVGLVLVIAGCPPMGSTTDTPQPGDNNNPGGDQTGNQDDGSNEPPTITTLPDETDLEIFDGSSLAKPTTTPPTPTPGATVLMNEIRFAPLEGDAPFVELLATPGTDLAGLMLFNQDGEAVTISAGAADANGLFLVVFGGAEAPENGISMPVTFLAPEAGAVELRETDGVTVLDQVAWGVGQLETVPLYTGGGGGPEEVIPGFALDRRPGDTTTFPSAWTAYAEEYVSPGAPNFYLGVEYLIPSDGSQVLIDEQALTWYEVEGAASYRVQIATAKDFQNLIVDGSVPIADFDAGLGLGTYFWRVQAIMGDGAATDFSPINAIEIVSEVTFEESTEDFVDTTTEKRLVAQDNESKIVGKELKNFPSQSQRKDSTMLLLESNTKSGAHAWNMPHSNYDSKDRADRMNCTLAVTKMVNHYYGGDLTQDRIGYELHKNDDPSGSETDLNYNVGNAPEKPLKFALGVDVIAQYRHKGQLPTYATLWNQIRVDIQAGRPIVSVTSNGSATHTRVVVGWFVDHTKVPAKAYVIILDPANEGKATAKRHPQEFYRFANALSSYDRLPSGKTIKGTKQEASLGLDSDNDMVNDFDETQRFGTDPKNPDSDDDCLSDFEEIKRSVFDEKHGYAHYLHTGTGDKAARTMKPRPEMARDYDGGGLPDFMEDWNRDGETGSGDSDPYDPKDDGRTITGTYERFKYWYGSPDQLNDLRDKISFTLESQADGTLKGTMSTTITDHREAMLTNSDENCPQPRSRVQDMVPVNLSAPVVGEFMCSENTELPFYITITADPPIASLSSPFTIMDECYGESHGNLTLHPLDQYGSSSVSGTITPTGNRALRLQYAPENADSPLPYETASNIRHRWDINISGK